MKNEIYWTSGLGLQEEMPIKLWETYSDAAMISLNTPGPMGLHPGMMKFVNAHMAQYTGALNKTVLLFGAAFVRLVCNRSGSLLAQGAFTDFLSAAYANVTGGSTTTITSAAAFLPEGQMIGDFVRVYDDAGGAGAAPEGEVRQIIKNTPSLITVQPPFSAAVAANDDIEYISLGNVTTTSAGSAIGGAGAVLAPDGIPDDYWGWVCCKGMCGVLIDNGVAVGRDVMLIKGTGRLTVSSSSAFNLSVGRSLGIVSTDIVNDMMLADIDVLFKPLPASA